MNAVLFIVADAVSRFSDMPEDDQRKVAAGVLFLVGVLVLAVYIALDWRK